MYNLYLLRGEFQHIIVTDVLRDMLEESSDCVQRLARHVCEPHVAPETSGGRATAHGRGRHRGATAGGASAEGAEPSDGGRLSVTSPGE